MDTLQHLKSLLSCFTVILLFTLIANLGLAQDETTTASIPKSFAVFVVRYNSMTREASGGVAGTAFFTSQNQAITAFHVLQEDSFKSHSVNDKVYIWLVHENHLAIPIQLNDLITKKSSDLTFIQFPNSVVGKDFVYQVARPQTPSSTIKVVTEGFVANSAGPSLKMIDGEVKVTEVKKLNRLHAEGQLLRSAQVSLEALDVTLDQTPCFQVSYQPVVGLSGGPLLIEGRVVGMNSFADPSRTSTWAVKISEAD